MENSEGGEKAIFNAIVAIIGVSLGDFASNWFMRAPELENGIALQDPATGEIVGNSRKCAGYARWQTATSRILMGIPVGIPGIVHYILAMTNMEPKSDLIATLLLFGLIIIQLTLSVPLGMSLYPQICTIKACDLEPEFHNIKSKTTGELISKFKYNKGL